ncbi:MAG: hypothetical protein J5666_00645 [Bacilli bacterium]|nr:hypothetical protein [Bacilli bacterium]
MVEDNTFTEAAKTDFKIRLVCGFVFGILAAIISLTHFSKKSPTSFIDGYLYRWGMNCYDLAI